MKGLTVYEKLLYVLMTKNIVSKTAILLISETPQPVYRAIKTAIENEHIKYYRNTLMLSKAKVEIEYYMITVKGIKYLIQQCSEKIPWLKMMSTTFTRIKIKGRKCTNHNLERFLRVTTAAVFAQETGAHTKTLYLTKQDGTNNQISVGECSNDDEYDLDDEEELFWDIGEADEDLQENDASNSVPTLAQMVHEAKRKYYEATGQAVNGIIKEYHSLNFVDSYEIKNTLMRMAKSKEETADILCCRYAGFLESRYQSVALYTGSPAGMAWQPRFARKEITVHAAYSKMVSEYHGVNLFDNNRAALLVTNKKMFIDLYTDKHKKRSDDELLGDGYTHFYVVPMTAEGKKQLARIVGTDIDKYNESIIEEAVDSGVYRKNTGRKRDIFPLINNNGTLIALGTDMNLLLMRRVAASLKGDPDMQFGFLCYPWQSEYYKAIFPSARIMLIEDEY